MLFNRILMVCLGNICRSPMAEGLLTCRLAQSNPEVEVASAGISAFSQSLALMDEAIESWIVELQ